MAFSASAAAAPGAAALSSPPPLPPRPSPSPLPSTPRPTAAATHTTTFTPLETPVHSAASAMSGPHVVALSTLPLPSRSAPPPALVVPPLTRLDTILPPPAVPPFLSPLSAPASAPVSATALLPRQAASSEASLFSTSDSSAAAAPRSSRAGAAASALPTLPSHARLLSLPPTPTGAGTSTATATEATAGVASGGGGGGGSLLGLVGTTTPVTPSAPSWTFHFPFAPSTGATAENGSASGPGAALSPVHLSMQPLPWPGPTGLVVGQAPTLQDYLHRDAIEREAHEVARRASHPGEDLVRLTELGRLASQHHLSPYSILKYGINGSPWPYIPLTLQQPAVAATTLQNQQINERRAGERQLRKPKVVRRGPVPALAFSAASTTPRPPLSGRTNGAASGSDSSPSLAASAGTKRSQQAKDELEQEAEASGDPAAPGGGDSGSSSVGSEILLGRRDSVMAEALARASPRARADADGGGFAHGNANMGASAKEDVVIHSVSGDARALANGTGSANRYGSASGQLHGADSAAVGPAASRSQTDDEAKRAGSEVVISNGPLSEGVILANELEPTLAQAHRTATAVEPALAHPTTVAPASIPLTIGGAAVKTSDTHPINISPIVPVQLMDIVAAGIYDTLPQRIRQQLCCSAPAALAGPSQDGVDEHVQAQRRGDMLIRAGPTINLVAVSASAAAGAAPAEVPPCRTISTSSTPATAHSLTNGASQGAAAAPLSQAQIQAQELAAQAQASVSLGSQTYAAAPVGNLFLSSCPGKKVRLTGPVRGRGAICRDLGLDLKRIQDIGVGAIVCCLDDEELAFLGAPWHEYEQSADALGIDVVRFPVAEGFAPTSHVAVDRAITSVVMDYSLRGVSVLVHCRGGVGRAGLIACTWMLKMGLVRSALESPEGEGEGMRKLPQDKQQQRMVVLDTVERLVDTIRRRRSPKAIETAEQVKFIVDYVSYLQEQEAMHARHRHRHQEHGSKDGSIGSSHIISTGTASYAGRVNSVLRFNG
ncbi:hypothetical protein K437DRAFT_272402 [Tilletiaria anomala UBC 951]|uniref:Tyrosine specific protein phosphatases domain-containing protein n=1 Tax=Tilletiaria anomala (strain ATCC 24038 / CBS 436.72 / UBC 951) TaxID=1037660 RepID=A0A066WF00_TILAU|nr:uncharacterized protein K437DRAFT_272402 [Tilletiaria anomala UBC 951]KDN52537.1 hypothetical protein K437DRAFT_272402 [Tilletiaria anomala UBC 951]